MAYNTFKSLVLVAATATSLIATPVLAAGEEARDVRVELRNIDLSSPAGQAQAERRIIRAARQACGYRSGIVPMHEQLLMKSCTERAIDSAHTRLAALSTHRDATLVVAAQPASPVPGAR